MSKTLLYLPEGSGLYLAVTSSSDITNFGWSLLNQESARVVVRFLRGRKMTKTEELHNEVAAALQFPWYYGENWPAFDECVNDLDWLPADFYFLIITEAEEVLSKEDDKQFSVLINILQQAAVEWSGSGEASDQLSRSVLGFYVIFQISEHENAAFVSRLESTGARYRYLNVYLW
jgi:RNAse (barnase) inhibitor barstar